jgi:UTP---glucose-1-phosphate uridylyltransferase
MVSSSLAALKECSSLEQKLQLLNKQNVVKRFLLTHPDWAWAMGALTAEQQVAFKSVVALGQGEIVFRLDRGMEWRTPLRRMLDHLVAVERFYDAMGGIVGYHLELMRLLAGELMVDDGRRYLPPPSESDELAVKWGIEALPQMAEIYPIGGAGDRLGLTDEETGESLPAACLEFEGRSLLAGLIRDLQAREHLYFKLFGERVVTPIVLMTSEEKENHRRVIEILEKNGWFGRPPSSFKLCTQCLVPVINEEGNWAMRGSLDLVMKPGGHGVIWKLMCDAGIFKWLREQGRSCALIRQINNPVAGIDDNLLRFVGLGAHGKRTFGFLACERRPGMAEGLDVLIELGEKRSITNIEYTDFTKHGVEDAPEFPANTNILFADLPAIEKQVGECMLPGALINMKHTAPFIDAKGNCREVPAGRLESTMQNIADTIWGDADPLPTYVVVGERKKTISVTKKSWKEGEPIEETPVGAWADWMENAGDLLRRCGFDRPPSQFAMHPALGPLWQIIEQKVRGGKVAEGSELELEIAELDMENLTLDGSLRILAKRPLRARCRLIDVTVSNRGIDTSGKNIFWRRQVKRREELRIELRGTGEFEAHGVHFSGDVEIVVPDGFKVTALQDGEGFKLLREPIEEPSWSWHHELSDGGVRLH